VVVLTAAGGGLLLGCRVGDRSGTRPPPRQPPPAFAPNAFIRIGTDGRVTLVMNQVEMGQGAYTSMPMLMAEELEVGLDRSSSSTLRPTNKLYANPLFGDQETVDRRRARVSTNRYGRAGATARTMLVAAAAQTWDVDPTSCRAKRGVVTHTPSGRTLQHYGALAEKAGKLPVPDKVALKDPKDFALIGTPAKRLDAPDKVNGKAQYGIRRAAAGNEDRHCGGQPGVGRQGRGPGRSQGHGHARRAADRQPGRRGRRGGRSHVGGQAGLAALAIRWTTGPMAT